MKYVMSRAIIALAIILLGLSLICIMLGHNAIIGFITSMVIMAIEVMRD